jgi:hypothetical protein
MKVDGRCHCGYIRYEAEIDPDTVALCNCTDCQTLSGSAFRTVVPTKKGSFKLLQGPFDPRRHPQPARSTRAQAAILAPVRSALDLGHRCAASVREAASVGQSLGAT